MNLPDLEPIIDRFGTEKVTAKMIVDGKKIGTQIGFYRSYFEIGNLDEGHLRMPIEIYRNSDPAEISSPMASRDGENWQYLEHEDSKRSEVYQVFNVVNLLRTISRSETVDLSVKDVGRKEFEIVGKYDVIQLPLSPETREYFMASGQEFREFSITISGDKIVKLMLLDTPPFDRYVTMIFDYSLGLGFERRESKEKKKLGKNEGLVEKSPIIDIVIAAGIAVIAIIGTYVILRQSGGPNWDIEVVLAIAGTIGALVIVSYTLIGVYRRAQTK